MKKIVSMVTIFLILFLLTYSHVHAASFTEELTTIEITTDKQTVHPTETVTLNVSFGQDMGAYTANVAYDNKLLEYVSSEGGTANDTGEKVILTYAYNQRQDPAPSNSMSITFRAKEEITTTNPTNLSISFSGLANPSASVEYFLQTGETIKQLIVEPIYEDYAIALHYTGDILVKEPKEMEIVISSAMGKNYEKTRILASVVTPEGESMQLLANTEEMEQYDLIESGWGSEEGDPLGGKDVVKKLQARGIFSAEGKYVLTLQIVNREDADAVIASNTFEITVGKTQPEEVVPPTPETNKPTTLPKTGNTIYFAVLPTIALLLVAYFALKRKD